eukprot:434388_1
MGTCCSLPSSTQIKIKAIFTQCDLEHIFRFDLSRPKQPNKVDYIGLAPLFQPHLEFECNLKISDTYYHFITKLSNIISKHIEFNSNILNEQIKYFRYETKHGLHEYTFKNNNDYSITFNKLFYDLSFIDWSSGYSLIIWFDSKVFKTNLDKAIQYKNINKIYQLLHIKHTNNYIYTPGHTTNYIQLEGEGESETDIQIANYPFNIVQKDIFGLLSMNDELITNYLIKNMHNNIDTNALIHCIENGYNISKNILIKYELQCIFTLSPLYVIQWHATRFNENICYLLARNGCFNIRQSDGNIIKIKELSTHHINPQNIKGIKCGRNERQKILIALLSKFKFGLLLVDIIEEFDSGNWKIFNQAVNSIQYS